MYVVDLLTDDAGFRNGVLMGGMVLVALTAIAVLRPHTHPQAGRSRHPLRLAGIGAVAAVLAALDRTGPSVLLNDRLVWGAALLVVLPLVATIVAGPANDWGRPGAALMAVPGALFVAAAAAVDNDLTWVPWFVAAAVVVGGLLTVDYDEHNARAGLPPVLLAATALAMWTTVPDTEQILVVVGVLLPLAFLGWPIARAAEGAAAYGVIGVLAWVAAVGGRGRPGSVVGAVACLGIFLVEPVVRRLWRGRAVLPRRPLDPRALASVAVHCAVVLVAARVAGLETSARTAGLIAAGALAVGAAAMGVVLAPRPARSRPPTGSADARNGAEPPTS